MPDVRLRITTSGTTLSGNSSQITQSTQGLYSIHSFQGCCSTSSSIVACWILVSGLKIRRLKRAWLITLTIPPMYQYFSVQDSASSPTEVIQQIGLRSMQIGVALTVGFKGSIPYRVNDGLYCGNASNMPMKDVEGGKTPPSKPKKDIVSSGKHPQYW